MQAATAEFQPSAKVGSGPGTFPKLPFARDFAKPASCALLPLVWRMAKVCYPPTLLMVQCMPCKKLVSALGWELPLDGFRTKVSFGPSEAKKGAGLNPHLRFSH
jgi:hypothetical protein